VSLCGGRYAGRMSGAVHDRDALTLGPGSGLRVPLDGVQTVGVAIPIPEPHGAFLQGKRAAFNDPMAPFIPAHVTLLGPTEVPLADFARLGDHLSAVAAAIDEFEMVLRGTGTFRPVSDVVFVQVAQGISACEALERSIRSGEWHQDLTFPYHPHVTVAHDVDEGDLDRAFEDLADFHARFTVAQIWLFVQGASGAWSPLRSFPLRRRGAPS
jgi:2'-5' RNA ligase